MVFTSNIFDGASSQANSSQASFNGGKAQNMEAPVYTQAFEAVSSSAPAPVPTLHKLPTKQPIRMKTLIWNNFLPSDNLPPYSQSGFSSPSLAPQATNHHCPNSSGNCGTESTGSVLGKYCHPVTIYPSYCHAGIKQPDEQGESDQDFCVLRRGTDTQQEILTLGLDLY
ncbi:hypothetical protein DSO57_1022936 [Entomophthora muscae]|uniref:Uncharacterized protein n=1 Tax=Entomophthora muscae TaxID=34485 RepID=A0ACC2UP69_9FUNG|nr:hypothetical protein DSO57_1022936 [Entomophthora muscae]